MPQSSTIPPDREVEVNFPWNFAVNLIDVSFITLGLSLVSRETIMPILVSSLTDSKFAIGLIPAIYSLGYYLPQLFIANYTERMSRVKPFVVVLSALGERGPYLLMGLAIWFLAGQSMTTLVAFFLLLATTAFATGTATPGWFTMIGKVLPVRRRGIFFGVSTGLGALMGILGAAFVGYILESRNYPNNFAILFIIAFIFTVISWIGLALNREPESPVVKEAISTRRYFRQLPQVLRRNQNYRRYLIAYSISKLGAMAIGFLVVYGDSSLGLSGQEVGLLTGTLIGSQAVFNLIWGWVGDRFGHKAVLSGSALALSLAIFCAWLVTSFSLLILAFIFLGVAMAGDSVSKYNIILEFAAPEDFPTYIGLTNTLLTPVIALAPLIGGAIATWIDYRAMFLVAMLISLLGAVCLVFWVREPRRHRGAGL